MKTVPLGHTGIPVSALCLGAMYFGTRQDEATSYRLLDQYMDAGGFFIDTANIYAHWVPGFKGQESEALLGHWIKQRRDRSRLFIASKVGFQYDDIQRGLTAKQIQTECEKSLSLLGVDTIDLYYAHVDDRETSMTETLEAFNRLVQAGKVRAIGASNFSAWRLEQARWTSHANGWAEYCCIQQRHTYLRPRAGTNFGAQLAVNDDLLDYCRNREITLLAYSALLSGAYTRDDRSFGSQYLGADNEARLEVLRQVSAEKNATPNQIILAWMLHGRPPVLPLIAASTAEQMDENIRTLEINLSAEDMARLDQAGVS